MSTDGGQGGNSLWYDKRTHPDWCVIGTENGSLGGVRGEYLLDMKEKAGWWKMPYYSAPVKIGKLLHFTMTHDYVAGDFMWTGVDYLGEAHWPARSSSARRIGYLRL